MVHCKHCNRRCSFIGEQPGTLKRYGRRMELWNCPRCGTTISRMRMPRPPYAFIARLASRHQHERRPLVRVSSIALARH